jgi:hypothetical protein
VNPWALATDSAGNLYIANGPSTIRKVDAVTGIISRFAGNGYAGFSGDGGSATVASLCDPTGLAFDVKGNLYFADYCNYRIRELSSSNPAATPTFSPAAGTYAAAQSVTISDTTANATIYYTTDGSTPTTGSAQYSEPISVASSETLNAIAIASRYTESAVATAAYVINQPSNPAPVISSLSPALTSAGSAAFTLTINGSGFVSSSAAYWGSTALTTTYVSATQINAQVAASAISSTGAYAITVQTPSPGGGTSNSFEFEVDTAGAAPPSFATVTATVTPGSSATYAVTLPSSATNVSASCLNLPSGAACSYSASAGTVTITTSSSTPAGTYQIVVVFTETLPGAATAIVFLPFVLLPLMFLRRKLAIKGIWIWTSLLLLVSVATVAAGCGGGASSPPPPPQTHQVTSSETVTLTVQ